VADADGYRDAPVVAPAERRGLSETFDGQRLYALRSTVAAHGSALGLDEQRVSDLVLVAHELASNAVRHGGATPERPGRLRLWREGTRVVCEVSDNGPGLSGPGTAGLRAAHPGAASGRGLWIVRRVADETQIATGPAGTVVTATLSLDGSLAPDASGLPD
jgi:anti-sigma regulatory factor (Ser/Thr protein kinase)